MKAGLAAFSKSGRTDISGTVEELACPGGKWPLFLCLFIQADKCWAKQKKTKKFSAA